jgi:hypothetical protein
MAPRMYDACGVRLTKAAIKRVVPAEQPRIVPKTTLAASRGDGESTTLGPCLSHRIRRLKLCLVV